jgi:hypothetical protein
VELTCRGAKMCGKGGWLNDQNSSLIFITKKIMPCQFTANLKTLLIVRSFKVLVAHYPLKSIHRFKLFFEYGQTSSKTFQQLKFFLIQFINSKQVNIMNEILPVSCFSFLTLKYY